MTLSLSSKYLKMILKINLTIWPLLLCSVLLMGCANDIPQSNGTPIPHPVIPSGNTQRTAEVVILRYEAALNACNAVIAP